MTSPQNDAGAAAEPEEKQFDRPPVPAAGGELDHAAPPLHKPSLAQPLRPCTRPFYPPGVFEGRDADGLPVFADSDGGRLLRVWGSGRLSDLELRQMKIVPADDMPMPLEAFAPNTSFAPFRFYRSTGKSDVEG